MEKKSGFNGATKWIILALMIALAAGGVIERLYNHGVRLNKVDIRNEKIEDKAELQGNAIISMQADLEHIKKGVDDLLLRNRN